MESHTLAAEPEPDAEAVLSLITEIQRVRGEIREGQEEEEQKQEETRDCTGVPAAPAGKLVAEELPGASAEEPASAMQAEMSDGDGDSLHGDDDSVMFLLGQIQSLHASLDAPDSAGIPRLQRLRRHVGSSSSLASLADDTPFPFPQEQDAPQQGIEHASGFPEEEPRAEADDHAVASDEDCVQDVSGDERSMVLLLAEVHKLQASLCCEYEDFDADGFETPEAASEPPAHDVSAPVLPSEAGAPPAGMKRSMSFNTQAQVDTLVSEAGSLLARLTSSDARGISNLLQDMSESNMLAAILSSELQGPDEGRREQAGGSTDTPSGETAMASSSQDACKPSSKDVLQRCGSGLKRSVSFSTQEQVQVLVEETAALMARLSSTDATEVSTLLQDMSNRNTLAAILACELEPEAQESVDQEKEVPVLDQEQTGVEVKEPAEEQEQKGDGDREDELTRYATFLMQNRRNRQSMRLAAKPSGPLEAALTGPQHDLCGDNGADSALKAPNASKSSRDYQYFLRRHKEKRKVFKTKLNASQLSANGSIQESPAECMADDDLDISPISRSLSESMQPALSDEGSATSDILYHHPFDVQNEDQANSVESILAGQNSPTKGRKVAAGSLKNSLSFNSQEQLQLLVEETAALMARLSSTDAADVSSVLSDMSERNALAAVLACELESEETKAASEPPAHDVSRQVLPSEAGAPPAGMKRSMSFNTQAQVDTLVSEAGSLLARLTSSDARGISNLLQDMSESNMLAAILSSELQGPDEGRREQAGESTDTPSGETAMVGSSHLLHSLASLAPSSSEASESQIAEDGGCAPATEIEGRDQLSGNDAKMLSCAPLSRTDSLTTMFAALKVEGAVVHTALGKCGSFVVNDTVTDEVGLAAELESKRSKHASPCQAPTPQPVIGRVSSLTRAMGEFRVQAAEVRRAISMENLEKLGNLSFLSGESDDVEVAAATREGEVHLGAGKRGDDLVATSEADRAAFEHDRIVPGDAQSAERLQSASLVTGMPHVMPVQDADAQIDEIVDVCTDLGSLVFPVIEYDSWDDESSDEESMTYVTPHRAIFIQSLKVLRMVTQNAQADFFSHWRTALCANVQQVEVLTKTGSSGPGAQDAQNIQETGVVQVEALPQSVKQTWPDLDVDGYHAATDVGSGS